MTESSEPRWWKTAAYSIWLITCILGMLVAVLVVAIAGTMVING